MQRGSTSHAPREVKPGNLFVQRSERKDLKLIPPTFESVTQLIGRLKRAKKRSGKRKQEALDIMINEFKQLRKELE